MAIDREKWIAALKQIEPVSDNEYLSLVELSEVWGCGSKPVKRRIEKLLKAGLVVLGSKFIVRSDGQRVRVPAYKLLDPTSESDASVGADVDGGGAS